MALRGRMRGSTSAARVVAASFLHRFLVDAGTLNR
jgi:hypothetical protein